jgi:hypothetical protein
MRWLMIALLVSVTGLLLAAAGVARHIWLQRSRLHSNPAASPEPGHAASAAFDTVEEADQESEP